MKKIRGYLTSPFWTNMVAFFCIQLMLYSPICFAEAINPVQAPIIETPSPEESLPISGVDPVEQTPPEQIPQEPEQPVEEPPAEETPVEEIPEQIESPSEETPVEEQPEEVEEELPEEIIEPLPVTVIYEDTEQSLAVIGNPVKWKKTIKLSGETDALAVELPEDAYDIQVSKIKGGNLHKVNHASIFGNQDKFKEKGTVEINTLSSDEILVEDATSEQTNKLVIGEAVEEVEIEYYTEAPQVTEEKISDNEKTITISSDNHYQDIAAFMYLPSEAPREAIHLYHIVDGQKEEVNVEVYDTNNNGLYDYIEWTVPHLSEQTYEVNIIVLNIQSYPILGGTWEVRFDTIGQADLTITAIDGTDFVNVLDFVELRCGDTVITTELTDGKIFVPDYSCDGQTGYEISKVMSMGKHTLEFNFGGVVAYAYNALSMSLNNPGNNTWDADGSIVFNCTFQVGEDNESVKNLSLWGNFNDSTWKLIVSNTSAVTNATLYSFPAQIVQNGTWLWNCEGYSNNSDSAFASANRTINVDSVSPVVNTLNNYGNNTWTTSKTVTFGFNLTDVNPDTCVLYHNASGAFIANATKTGITSNASTNFSSIAFASDGHYLWNVLCNDSAGSSAWFANNYTLKVDSATPTVSLDAPANNASDNDGTVTFQYTPTDTNLDSCSLYHNVTGTFIVNITNSSLTSGAQLSNTRYLPNGTYIWNIWCNDSAGNTAFNGTNYTLIVDSANPVVNALNNYGNNTWTTSRTATFGFNVTDDHPGTCVLYHNASGAFIANTTATFATNANTNFSSIAFASDGSYLWNVLCNDSSGNSAWFSNNYTLKIDTDSLVVNSLNNYGNNTWTTSKTVTFGFNATEDSPDTCVLYHNASGNFVANVSTTYTSNANTNLSAITFASDGYYIWNVKCNDSAGNSRWFTSNYTLKVDSANPTISLIAPGNNTWDNDGSVNFSYTPTDTNIGSCVLYHNVSGNFIANITNSSLTSGTQLSNILSLSDGFYIWNVLCNDSAGNSVFNGTNYTIKVDNTDPVVNSLNNYGNNTWTTSKTVTFGFNLTEANIDTCVLYHNASGNFVANATVTSITSNANTNFSSIAFASDGNYIWNVLCNDSAGQTDWFTNNYTLKVDSTNPIINNMLPANSGYITNTASTRFQVSLTEQNLNDAVNVTVYYRRSGVGGYSSASLNCSGTPSDYTCNKTIDLSSLLGENEVLQFFFNTTDSAGLNASNGTQSSPLTATVDSINPVVNALNNYGNNTWTTSKTVTFGFNATDNNQGTCVLYHTASGTFVANVSTTYTSNANTNFSSIAFASDGDYIWNVLCNDSAGNSAWFSNNYTLKIDSANPTISLIAPTNNTWDNDGSVNFSYTPADTNLGSCILYHNVSGNFIANITNSSLTSGTQLSNILSLSDGFYIWNVLCNDSAGNSAFNGTNYTIKVDNTDPVVNSLNNYGNNTYTTSQTVTFGFNLTEANIDTCVLYHNASGNFVANATVTSITSNANTNFSSIAFASDGDYLWNVLCNDSAGQTDWFTYNYTLHVDSASPTVSLDSPANDTWDSDGSVTFQYTPRNTHLDACVLWHNISGIWAANITNTSLTSGVQISNTLSLTDGNYIWNVRCNDSAGNAVFNGTNYTIKVDQTRPVINNTTPASGGYMTNPSAVIFQVSLTEQNINTTVNVTTYYRRSGVGSYQSTSLNCFGTAPNYVCNKTVDLSSLLGENEVLQFFFNTTDSAGLNASNGTQSSPLTATVDSINPVVNALNNYGNNTWTTSKTVTFGFNTSDNHTATCVLYHNASGIFAANVSTTYTSNANTNFSSIAFAADGDYIWNVLCNDSAGQTDWFTNNYTLKIDSASPTIALSTPSNNSWNNNGIINFSYTPTDTNIDACVLYHNASGTWTANITNSSLTSGAQLSNNLTLSDGFYIWNVKCNDSAGNSMFNGTNYTIKVDNTDPVVNSLNNYGNNTWTTSKTVTFGFNLTEANIDTCVLYHNASGNFVANATVTSITSNANTNFSSIAFASDGDYIWNVLCNDSAGQTDWFTNNYTIRIDTANPAIALVAPSNNTWDNDGSVNFSYTPTDTNIGSCVLYHNVSGNFIANITNSSLTSGTQLSNILSLSDGFYIWNVLCNDSAGHAVFNGTNYTIKVDNTDPVVNSLNNYGNNTWTTSKTVTFGFNLTESNIDTCVLYHNASGNFVANATVTSITSNANTNFSSITFASDGDYLWNVLCNDSAGQTDWFTNNYTLKIDSASPTVSIDVPANNTWDNDGSVTFGYTPTDTNIGSCVLYHNVSGTWTANITNSSLTSGSQLNNTLSLSDGFYIWNVKCNDSAGNSVFNGTNYTIKVDNTDPVVNSLNNYGNNTWTTSKTVTFGFNLTEANIDTCVLYHNASGNFVANATVTSITSNANTNFSSITFASDGNYIWNVLCNDSAGQTDWFTNNYTLKVDSANPTISLVAPGNNTWDNDGSVNFSYIPTDTNIDTCVLYHNASGTWTTNITNSSLTSGTQLSNILSLSDGSYIWNVKCNDSAGNSVFNGTNYTIKVDNTDPVVNSLNNYGNNTWTTSKTVTFGFNLTEANIDTCVLYHNASGNFVANATVTSITSNANTNFSSITFASDGNYIWNVLCNDSAGQTDWFTNNYTLHVDSANPAITLNLPANSTWQTTNSITFSYTPTDANIDSCILYHNVSGWSANTTNSSLTSGTADTTPYTISDGIYLWNVLCNDSAGNSAWAESSNRSLRVDATGPTAALTNLSAYSTTTFTVAWSANDTYSGVANYNVQVNDNGAGWTNWLTSTTSTSLSYTGTSSHTYYFRVNATDNAGNSGNYSANVSTTISTSAPTMTFYQNAYGPYSSDPGNVINVTFNDADGLDYAQYKIGANGTWTNIFSSNYAGTSYTSLWNVSWASLEVGTNTIYVRAYDDAGNAAEPAQTFTVRKSDTTPPAQVTGVTALAWTGANNKNIMINWTANSESDLSYYKVYVNNVAVGTSTINQYTYPTPFDGTWTINVSAVDTSGNEGNRSTAVSVTIDTTAPSLTGTSPGGLTTDDTPTIQVNTSEASTCKFDDSDVAYESMSYTMNGTSTTTHNYTFTTSLNDSDLAGDYVYYVRCNDSNGNVMTTSSFVSFVLDTDGNYNYTQWLYPTWDTLWLPDSDIMTTMGYSNFSINSMLSNSRFLHNNPYTDVYYYNGSSWIGYSPATGWAGSDLKYVNNTNDKPYWLKLNTTIVTTKTRFQI